MGAAAATDDWITTVELLDRLAAAGHPTTVDQLERWRGAKLLPAIDQAGNYSGSIVRHPPETFRQTIAIHQTLKRKYDFKFVGAVLWAEGFNVGEQYWREPLQKAARWADRIISIARWVQEQSNRRDTNQTFGERLSDAPFSKFVHSRISRRLNSDEFAVLFGLLIDVTLGEFDGYPYSPEPDAHAARAMDTGEIVVRALDLEAARTDTVLGQRLRLVENIEATFKAISAAMAVKSFVEIAEMPEVELRRSMQDALNGLRIGLCWHETMERLYGPQAFGVRLLAWTARKADIAYVRGLTLGLLRLRQVSNDLLSSTEIAALAQKAKTNYMISVYLEHVQKTRPDLGTLLSRERMKLAFNDVIENKRWQAELAEAKILPIPLDVWASIWPPPKLLNKHSMI